MRIQLGRILVVFAVLVSLNPTGAEASMIVTLESVTPSLVYPGYYEWEYSVTVDPTDGLRDAYFTIYDFGPIFTASSAWQVDVNNLGITPAGLTPVDDPLIENLTFLSDLNQPGGETFPGMIVYSAIGAVTPGVYTWQDVDGYPTGSPQSGAGVVGIPDRSTAPPVPEPALLSLAAIGVGGLALRRRRRSGYVTSGK